jgi:hypothetical protein
VTEISEQGHDNAPLEAAPSGEAGRTASRAARVLAYWRWGKISELLEAAGQLALFDRADTTTPEHEDAGP